MFLTYFSGTFHVHILKRNSIDNLSFQILKPVKMSISIHKIVVLIFFGKTIAYGKFL